MKIKLLTRKNCPNCNGLKLFLEKALNNKYKDKIEILEEEQNRDIVGKLIEKFNIQSFPAMIKDENVLVGFQPSKLINFLETNA